jgi:hypothetical protein
LTILINISRNICYICSKMRLPIVLPCSSACKCGKKKCLPASLKKPLRSFLIPGPIKITQSKSPQHQTPNTPLAPTASSEFKKSRRLSLVGHWAAFSCENSPSFAELPQLLASRSGDFQRFRDPKRINLTWLGIS